MNELSTHVKLGNIMVGLLNQLSGNVLFVNLC